MAQKRNKKETRLYFAKQIVHPANSFVNEFGFESMEDKEIWSSFKKGHEGAFNFIYRKYFPILFRYGHGFTRDREIVKDCIQDLFIELRQSGKNLSDTTSIKYYLYRSIRYKILHYLKKNSPFSFTRVTGQWSFEFEVSHETKMIQEQLDQEQKEKLERVLKKLTKRQKEAVVYFFYEGFSYQQISSIMRMRNVKSARNLIYRALKKMKNSLEF